MRVGWFVHASQKVSESSIRFRSVTSRSEYRSKATWKCSDADVHEGCVRRRLSTSKCQLSEIATLASHPQRTSASHHLLWKSNVLLAKEVEF